VKLLALVAVCAAVLAFGFMRMTADAASPSTIPTRVTSLERQVKKQANEIYALHQQVTQLYQEVQGLQDSMDPMNARIGAIEEEERLTP